MQAPGDRLAERGNSAVPDDPRQLGHGVRGGSGASEPGAKRASDFPAAVRERVFDPLPVAHRVPDAPCHALTVVRFAIGDAGVDVSVTDRFGDPVAVAVAVAVTERDAHDDATDESVGDAVGVGHDRNERQLGQGDYPVRHALGAWRPDHIKYGRGPRTANLAGMDTLASGSGPPLFLVPPGGLGTGTVKLSGPEGHHAAAVRRLRAGERADVSDGAGTLAECVVASVAADVVVLTVRSVHAESAPEPRITVVQALPKGDRAELAVEMMTEVGVDSIIAWAAERSVTRWHGDRGERALAKWRVTAREAAKQSRRAWIPEVTGPARLSGITDLAAASALAVVLEPDAATPLSRLPLPDSGDIMLIVGPEGGISPAERTALAGAGAAQARLGPTVLRTSTAGAAAAAILLARTGRW